MKIAEIVANIDVNDIFYQLHEIAKKQAEAVNANIEVVNLGVDDENKTFFGPGDNMIFAIIKDLKFLDDNVENFKKSCFDVIKKYVEFFASEDIVKQIKEDDLAPVNGTFEQEKKNSKSKEKVNSSLDFTSTMLTTLFEANETKTILVGYSLPYKLELEGQKEIKLKDKLERRAKKSAGLTGTVLKGILKGTSTVGKELLKGMFGGVLKDLASVKFHGLNGATVSGKDLVKPFTNIAKGFTKFFKKSVAPKIKELFEKKNIGEVKALLEKRLKEKYPGNKAKVELQNKQAVIKNLKQKKKMTNDINDKLSNSKIEQVITVAVSADDDNYESFSIKSIAENLYYAINASLIKRIKIDDEKQQAEVKQFFHKNFKIFKVENLDNTNFKNKVTIKKEKVQSAESLAAKYIFMSSLFETIHLDDFNKALVESNSNYILVEDKDMNLTDNTEANELLNKISYAICREKTTFVDKDKAKEFAKKLEKAYKDGEITYKELYTSKAPKGVKSRGLKKLINVLQSENVNLTSVGAALEGLDNIDGIKKLLGILGIDIAEPEVKEPEEKSEEKSEDKEHEEKPENTKPEEAPEPEKTDSYNTKISINKNASAVTDIYIIVQPTTWFEKDDVNNPKTATQKPSEKTTEK